jgi:hypothetical protein
VKPLKGKAQAPLGSGGKKFSLDSVKKYADRVDESKVPVEKKVDMTMAKRLMGVMGALAEQTSETGESRLAQLKKVMTGKATKEDVGSLVS